MRDRNNTGHYSQRMRRLNRGGLDQLRSLACSTMVPHGFSPTHPCHADQNRRDLTICQFGSLFIAHDILSAIILQKLVLIKSSTENSITSVNESR